jgi:CRP-like cAMP-binding protein
MKIGKTELNKPVAKNEDGEFLTLKELLEGKIIIKDEMDPEDYRDLSIARYEMMDSSKAIVIGGVSYTKDQIIEKVKKKTEVGDRFVEMQARFIRMLIDKKEEIEIA